MHLIKMDLFLLPSFSDPDPAIHPFLLVITGLDPAIQTRIGQIPH